MKTLTILIPSILLLFSCQSNPPEKQKSFKDGDVLSSAKQRDDLRVDWVFEEKYGDDGDPTMPVTDIYVEINGKKLKVIEGAQGSFRFMDKAQRISWKIPASALSACLGGWGGLYRCVYAEMGDNEVTIKQAWNDAESAVKGWSDMEEIKIIKFLDMK